MIKEGDYLIKDERAVVHILKMDESAIITEQGWYSVHAFGISAGLVPVASMNRCQCGYYNHPTKDFTCAPGQVAKYLNKISGLLLRRTH